MGSPTRLPHSGPGAVIILDVVVAKQIFQDKPGMRVAFADAATGERSRFPVTSFPY
jgi:hypothetical protein